MGNRKIIIVNLDVMMAKRKMSSNELAQKIGITNANLSILKTNKGKAIRFSTLDKICEVLECTPGDILEYVKRDAHFWQVVTREWLYGGALMYWYLYFTTKLFSSNKY